MYSVSLPVYSIFLMNKVPQFYMVNFNAVSCESMALKVYRGRFYIPDIATIFSDGAIR